ncbi:MAG: 2-amino-4-hydroxy-6-hydroxymethyldihydropteridine diphosphokinase [Cryomorphaceae bacterium]
MNHQVTTYLSLGSNLGDRRAYLNCALSGLSAKGVVEACSAVWETPPWGYTDEKPYLNMACAYRTSLDAFALRLFLEGLERECGRAEKTDKGQGYAAREIDIDIIFYGSEIIDTPELTVPHPRMEMRNFVLRPLREIAPKFVHPLSGQTVEELCKQSPDEDAGLKLYDGL